ncbi:MAG: hypothetical protein U1F59_12665 [Candidatus Competibacteraceae bacterium]|jgi:predicted RNA-binding protein with RPS1 domain
MSPDAKAVDFNKLAQNFSKIIEQSQRVLQEHLKRQERNDQRLGDVMELPGSY